MLRDALCKICSDYLTAATVCGRCSLQKENGTGMDTLKELMTELPNQEEAPKEHLKKELEKEIRTACLKYRRRKMKVAL